MMNRRYLHWAVTSLFITVFCKVFFLVHFVLYEEYSTTSLASNLDSVGPNLTHRPVVFEFKSTTYTSLIAGENSGNNVIKRMTTAESNKKNISTAESTVKGRTKDTTKPTNPKRDKQTIHTVLTKTNQNKTSASYQNYIRMVEKVLQWFMLDRHTTKDHLINAHRYAYNLNSNICQRKTSPLLIVVHSRVGNYEKRNLIRSKWGAIHSYRNVHIGVVFMLGLSNESGTSMQKQVQRESNRHGDIVQGNFNDTYRNLTYKHIMSLYWAVTSCGNTTTIVKIDDDVFIDIPKLVNHTIRGKQKGNTIMCSVFTRQIPHRKGKWGISKAEYPFPAYPSYCEGYAYILSMSGARRLVKASEHSKFCWIDDVFVTGVLAERAGIRRVGLPALHRALKRGWFKEEANIDTTKGMFFAEFKDWDALSEKVLHKDSRYRNNAKRQHVFPSFESERKQTIFEDLKY